MAVEAAKWRDALGHLGYATVTIAGCGPVDRLLPGLEMGASEPPTDRELQGALVDADLVVVENLCSLPLNVAAAAAVARVLAGRPAILHHHDLPWQRPEFLEHPPPPTDRCWSHVTINELSRRQLAAREIAATTVYNSFPTKSCTAGSRADQPSTAGDAPGGAGARSRPPAVPTDGRGDRRMLVRTALGVGHDRCLVLQPTRAISRKNVAGGVAAAVELDATYWLLGPPEDGYEAELRTIVAEANCPVVLGPPPDVAEFTVRDAYAACDVVTLPSTWEGFGNPSVESAVYRRPLIVGPYPVAAELASFGFEWFPLDEVARLKEWRKHADGGLLDRNESVADTHFSIGDLPVRLAAVLPDL
ncbi:MAG: glycosyltransferase family protein [Acidimicrobiales bacterium]